MPPPALFWARSIQSIPPSLFQKIHLNIVISSTHGLSKWSLSLRIAHQNPVCTTPHPHTHYITRPSHSSLFDHLNIIGWHYKSLNSLLCSFLQSPGTSSVSNTKYSPEHPIFKHPQPMFLPQCERPSFKPIKINRQNYSSVYLKSLSNMILCLIQ